MVCSLVSRRVDGNMLQRILWLSGRNKTRWLVVLISALLSLRYVMFVTATLLTVLCNFTVPLMMDGV